MQSRSSLIRQIMTTFSLLWPLCMHAVRDIVCYVCMYMYAGGLSEINGLNLISHGNVTLQYAYTIVHY